VGRLRVGKSEDAFAEDDHVDVNWLHVVFAVFVHLKEGFEADKVVLFEQLDFLAGFLGDDILGAISELALPCWAVN